MEKFDSEQRFWIRIWLIIGLSVCSLAFIISSAIIFNNRQAFDAGYERATVAGLSTSVWQKCDDKE